MKVDFICISHTSNKYNVYLFILIYCRLNRLCSQQTNCNYVLYHLKYYIVDILRSRPEKKMILRYEIRLLC